MAKRTSGMFPSFVFTIGGMRSRMVEVRAICTVPRCGYRDIDLDKLIALKGPEYSLMNRRCRCRITAGCSGWNRFYYHGHGRMCPLWSDERARDWIEKRWAQERAANRPNLGVPAMDIDP